MNQIPTTSGQQFNTRNTKEAALLYAFEDVQPCRASDGNPYAFRVKDKDGGEVCYFVFQPGKVADLIHEAFTTPGYAELNAGEIPDQYLPQVLSLVLQMWHNWERLKDATKGLPLHAIVQKDNRIYIKAVKGGAA